MIQMIGKRFGKLTVISYSHKDKYLYYNCKCDCGKEKKVTGKHLRIGDVKSCGCLRKDVLAGKVIEHGLTRSRFYRIWCAMKSRCTNINQDNYERYGGRGIKVCLEWQDFKNFRDDMYDEYIDHVKKFGEKETSIDRISSEKNYYKNNCRWATIKEQSNNKRKYAK